MKILVIRFSSIGDIVLTTSVIRCIKTQIQNVELHFLSKSKYYELLEFNPYIDKILNYHDNLHLIIKNLRKENYDLIIDLHKSIRSRFIRTLLMVKSISYSKLNFRKFLLVNFKINTLPDYHLIDRYFNSLKKLGIANDYKGNDIFIPQNAVEKINKLFEEFQIVDFYAIVIGGTYFTKCLPPDKIIKIVDSINFPVILLGGVNEKVKGDYIKFNTKNKVINLCGECTVLESSAIINRSKSVLSNDTGLMHIAAALGKRVVSVWGNTVPKFGMFPYYGTEQSNKEKSVIIEINGLECRPCSKLGLHKCPKKHFRCMNDLNEENITKAILAS